MTSSTADMTIRAAGTEDLEEVITLDERVTGICKRDYINELFERYQTRQSDKRFFYVAVGSGEGRQVIGFVIGEIRSWEFGSEPCGWVFAISVDPQAREDGIGAALLDRICESFAQAGVSRIRTMISRNNHLLMSFFRSKGLRAGPYIQLEKDIG